MLSTTRTTLLLALVATLGACSRPAPPPEPVRAVKLQAVAAGPVPSGVEYAAEIRARTESRLGFRVGGKLVQRPAEVGQQVRAGQLLAVIDPQDYQLGAQAARAQLAAAQTQRDLAAADFKRFESLREQGFISAAELDRRQAALQAAEAGLAQARAQADVQVNQAAYTRLLADAYGVVVAVEAEPGQVLAAGAPVLRLARQGPRDAVLSVPEDRVQQLRTGQAATVALWSQGSSGATTLKGTVREVAAAADPATRTYAVKVALAENQAQPPLGATASVRLQSVGVATAASGSAPAWIRLPSASLWKQGQGSAVWVFDAKAQQVRARSVQVAGLDGNEAVITSGLQPGEEVVVAGVHVLTEGQSVTRYQPGAAPVTSPPASR